MSEEFRWISPEVYKWWVGSYHYRRLMEYAESGDGEVLQLPKGDIPATLPFLPREFHTHPATMNPFLASWIWRRFVREGDVVVEPMVGVGGRIRSIFPV
ncbi:hypothetical protein HRbin01_00605 [archaeon HR01]|nr:hypothetical protein HRbin01_00605 [archaeon HR01]